MAGGGLKLTSEQREAIMHDGHAMVEACPGSGKTRTLAAKLLRCLDEVRDTPRRVACITYTNAAVQVITKRVRQHGNYDDIALCDISTIHAFCLEHVLRPYHWLSSAIPAQLSVLPPDSPRYREIVSDLIKENGLDPRARDQFELLNRDVSGTPIALGPISTSVALEFWARLEAESFVDFPNIVYHSYRLILEFPWVGRALASRYASILVDEFQDTSALQVAIFDKIASYGTTTFFVVGDPYQSIYGFAGARRELMHTFAATLGANVEFRLLGNFRSSQNIITHAERLFARVPAMTPTGPDAEYPIVPVYVHCSSTVEAIWDHYLPLLDRHGIHMGEAAILAPQWFALFPLGRELRQRGVSILGPGARPYRRSHLLAPLAEQIGEYIERPDAELIPLIERELFNLLTNVTGRPVFRVFSYEGRTTVMKLVKNGAMHRISSPVARIWIESIAHDFGQILLEDDLLSPGHEELLADSADAILEDISRNQLDAGELTVADLGMFANARSNLKLLTMHRAKGQEFDAVAIIDLHDGKVPHYSASSAEELEEARRLLYVGITRAKRILMYATDSSNRRNRPSPFLLDDWLSLVPTDSAHTY